MARRSIGLAVAAVVAACRPDPGPPPAPPPAPVHPAAAPAPAATSGATVWGADYFPNVVLTTQQGTKVRFFDDLIRDKVVAINFIFTRCTDACPMETARLLEVQKLLAGRLGRDVFFYSISIDPTHDTPDVLRDYAARWHTGPGWTFLTGSEADITSLRKKLGVFQADLQAKDHNLSLLIGNQRTGQWMKRSPYENPYILAEQLGSWLSNWQKPRPTDRDYAHAPEVRNISSGEELFRARCAACHTVGGGDLVDLAQHRVGPDLRGVTARRDRDWLARWIMHPDGLLAARDPIAVELLERYQHFVMPNLRLDDADTAAVLGYLDDVSRPAPPPAQVTAQRQTR